MRVPCIDLVYQFLYIKDICRYWRTVWCINSDILDIFIQNYTFWPYLDFMNFPISLYINWYTKSILIRSFWSRRCQAIYIFLLSYIHKLSVAVEGTHVRTNHGFSPGRIDIYYEYITHHGGYKTRGGCGWEKKGKIYIY